MVKLKDILRRGDQSGPKLLTSQNLKNATTAIATRLQTSLMTTAIVPSMSTDETTKFSIQAAEIVTQDEFLDELESKIGDPKENESEDAFVFRAKEQMRTLLKSKLK